MLIFVGKFMTMKRRDFIKTGIGGMALAGTAMSLPGYARFLPGFASNPALAYDLVAVKGGEPGIMFDKAIESLGGMKMFVKPGQKVVVKPNIGWDVPPERAGNTNPLLVKRIIQHCLDAGAKEVYVFDNTCDNWSSCYKTSGIEFAAKEAGAKVAPGNSESYYQEVTVPGGKKLKTTKVHELMLSSDVFINVPVLKSHSSARLTIGMKNYMGIVWDRGWWHRNDLQQCIADCITWRKPDLTIVDAYNVMMKNGPRGVSEADVKLMKSLIISPDMVAIDAAAAKMFGTEPGDVPYIGIAESMGVGTAALDKLNVHRIIL